MPEAYAAGAGAPLTLRRRTGAVPEYETGSLNMTAISIGRPSRYAPSGVPEATAETLGADVSTTMPAEPDSERGVPGSWRVRLAALPAASAMLPDKAPVFQ